MPATVIRLSACRRIAPSLTLLTLLGASSLAGAATSPGNDAWLTVTDEAKACEALAGTKVAPAAFALPTGEASVQEAMPIAATAAIPVRGERLPPAVMAMSGVEARARR